MSVTVNDRSDEYPFSATWSLRKKKAFERSCQR